MKNTCQTQKQATGKARVCRKPDNFTIARESTEKKKLKWKVPSNGKGKRGRGSGEETMGSRPLERLPHRSTGATNHLLGLANEDNLSSWRRWGLQVWNRESCWRGDAGSPKTRRGSSAAAIGSCERGHELGLAGPRAGEDASGCPDEPARDSREGG